MFHPIILPKLIYPSTIHPSCPSLCVGFWRKYEKGMRTISIPFLSRSNCWGTAAGCDPTSQDEKMAVAWFVCLNIM
ncbi:3872_t:CDS:2 [Ambispora leptoticha]|uniref:3872_t:CDS:1 n=1 Tax=Ambispora leptoticha TaxID=144679 RepID=A0A9N9A6C7_9GLOM|nr:3872_t:CDS:2 [Ambispora leptoticha]